MSNPAVRVRLFGTLERGEQVQLWTLEQGTLSVSISEWGATIQSVRVPDRAGRIDEVALGFPRLEQYLDQKYLASNPYFGSTIGRYANRIAWGQFELDGVRYQIPCNDRRNSLHGGERGFDQRPWKSTPLPDGVKMTRTAADGEEGFPGALEVAVDFRLADGALQIEYSTRTDQKTVVNLTNHTYWNLAGEGDDSATSHVLRVDADSYLPVDEMLIPIGTLEPVAESPFDFRQPSRIEEHLRRAHRQLEWAGGIDHTLVLRPPSEPGMLRTAMTLSDPASGRMLTITTSEPGLQVYTGNFLDGTFCGHSGRPYMYRSGLAFEPQHFPDSPNRPAFPTTELSPGKRFHSITRYGFGLTR